jgi:hypothetical protein
MMHYTRGNVKELPVVLTHENRAFHVILKIERDYFLVLYYLVGISKGRIM